MESALVSIISVALVIIASVTMMVTSFSSINSVMESWQLMEKEADIIRRTDISARPPDSYNGGIIEVMVSNEGETMLSSFDKWDVIARYQTGGISYVEYTENPVPGGNQWSLEGIYLTDNTSVPEIFDYNVLNPGESARLYINLSPGLDPGDTGLITASTSNGVTSQCMVSRQQE
jgi:hypothetical protein